MRVRVSLILVLLGVSPVGHAADCPSDRVLNGKCIKNEESCRTMFATPILQRSCRALAQMPLWPQWEFESFAVKWKTNPGEMKSDRDMIIHILSDAFPGGRTQLNGAVKACRGVVADYRKSGLTVNEAKVHAGYRALQEKIAAIGKAATVAYGACPPSPGTENVFAHEHEAFDRVDEIRQSSVNRYFDGTLDHLGLVRGIDLGTKRAEKKNGASPACQAALDALNNTGRDVQSMGSDLSGYAIGDTDAGTIYNFVGTRFNAVPTGKPSELGLVFFRTYQKCVELLDEYAIAGYDPARKLPKNFDESVLHLGDKKDDGPGVDLTGDHSPLEDPAPSGNAPRGAVPPPARPAPAPPVVPVAPVVEAPENSDDQDLSGQAR